MGESSPLEETQATYRRIAADYARRAFPLLAKERAAFLRHLHGRRVLDAGCGTGFYARLLAEEGLEVVALDLSAAMLRQAQALGLRRLVRGDLLALPFPQAAFDGIFASASLVHLPRALFRPALQELHRLLADGGILYLSLKGRAPSAAAEGWATAPEGGRRFYSYYTEAEAEAALQASGFECLHRWRDPAPGEPRAWLGFIARARQAEKGPPSRDAGLEQDDFDFRTCPG